MWYVYVLANRKANFVYIGSTNSLNRRVRTHKRGLNQSTKHYRPLQLLAFIAVPTNNRARELEKYFKTGSGKAVLKKRILGDEVRRRRT